MIVTIPACIEHRGIKSVTLEIADKCPVCGGPRGEPYKTSSYDGSRRLQCDGWMNPCGHVDKYSDVRKEGRLVQSNSVQDKGIRSCPFCHVAGVDEQTVMREQLEFNIPWQVGCSCGARGPHADTRSGAIRKWNEAGRQSEVVVRDDELKQIEPAVQ